MTTKIWVVRRDHDSKTHIGVRQEVDGRVYYNSLCGTLRWGRERFKASPDTVSCLNCKALSAKNF